MSDHPTLDEKKLEGAVGYYRREVETCERAVANGHSKLARAEADVTAAAESLAAAESDLATARRRLADATDLLAALTPPAAESPRVSAGGAAAAHDAAVTIEEN